MIFTAITIEKGRLMNFIPGEINIICTDIDASLYFYRDILGFDWHTDEDGFYHFDVSGFQFLLLPIAKKQIEPSPYGDVPQMSMDVYVDDLAAAYKYFKQNKVEFAQEWEEGSPMFVIRDPDGLPWEVVEANI